MVNVRYVNEIFVYICKINYVFSEQYLWNKTSGEDLVLEDYLH